MRSSKRGLMKQIRRALFPEDDAEVEQEHENSQHDAFHPSAGGCTLANLGHEQAPSKKNRRGRRQKWNASPEDDTTSVLAQFGSMSVSRNCIPTRKHHQSRNEDEPGMSVLLAGASNGTSTSSFRSSNRTLNFDPSLSRSNLSVLVGSDDQSTMSQSSRRHNDRKQAEVNQGGDGGGLMSLFDAATATQKANRVNRDERDEPKSGGLFGALGVETAVIPIRKTYNAKRGRLSSKRVTWAHESSLVSTHDSGTTRRNAASLASKSCSKDDSGSMESRNMTRGNALMCGDKRDGGLSSLVSHSSSLDDRGRIESRNMQTVGQETMTQSNLHCVPHDEEASVPTKKAEKRTNTKRRSSDVHANSVQVTSPKGEEDVAVDDFVTVEDPVDVAFEENASDSDIIPSKRRDMRSTPEKFDVIEESLSIRNLEEQLQPDTPRLSSEQEDPVREATNEKKSFDPLPFVPSSKVLEVEYIPISFYAPSPADTTNNQGMRRSLRRPVPTDSFSPSMAMMESKLRRNETTQLSLPASPSSPMEIDESQDTEPVIRRSGRNQIPTDRFTPGVPTKRSQRNNKKASHNVNRNDTEQSKQPRAKVLKSFLHKDNSCGRPSSSEPAVTDTKTASESTEPRRGSNVNSGSERDSTESKENQLPASGSGVLSTVEEWSDDQLRQLKESHSEVDPTSTSFWNDISNHVDGKSSQECREKWFSLVKTPAQRTKRPGKKEATLDIPIGADFSCHSDDEDDIFNSTPLRGTLFHNDTKSVVEYQETDGIDFDIGSPLTMWTRRDRRISNEYDDGNEAHAFQKQRFGYKTYMMGLKRGVARANQEKKGSKKKKNDSSAHEAVRTLTESVGNGDVALKGHLTPGGTLNVKNLTETEDDFLDYMSESDDCDELS